MPRLKNAVVEEKATVIASTHNEEKKNDLSQTSNKVVIACHLQTGIRFDNIVGANGLIKSVTLPGINDHLRGKGTGILLGVGESVAVTLDRSDWEQILKLYGDMGIFKSFNGFPPAVMEMKGGRDEFDNSDEVKAQINGNEPLDEDNIISKTTR